jgi:hypothetical protein
MEPAPRLCISSRTAQPGAAAVHIFLTKNISKIPLDIVY